MGGAARFFGGGVGAELLQATQSRCSCFCRGVAATGHGWKYPSPVGILGSAPSALRRQRAEAGRTAPPATLCACALASPSEQVEAMAAGDAPTLGDPWICLGGSCKITFYSMLPRLPPRASAQPGAAATKDRATAGNRMAHHGPIACCFRVTDMSEEDQHIDCSLIL